MIVDKGLAMVIGMSISYLASFAGMCLAWWNYRKRHGRKDGDR